MGCIPGKRKKELSHQDRIDQFSYANDCKEWVQEFHLKIGERQSPINIVANEVLDVSNAPIQMKLKFNSSSLPILTEYTKTSFRTQPSTQPIAEILLIDSADQSKTQLYQSYGLHFHAKSEHEINGVQYAAEVHIVFKRSGNAVIEDQFCVIGILFKCDDLSTDEDQRRLLTEFHPESPQQALSVNMSEILEKTLLQSMEFYHYKGSLTTPPCTESVNWFVHPHVFTIKAGDLESFHEKWDQNAQFSPTKTGNARPVCPLNNRKIYTVKAKPWN